MKITGRPQTLTDERVFRELDLLALTRQKITAGRLKAEFGGNHDRYARLIRRWEESGRAPTVARARLWNDINATIERVLIERLAIINPEVIRDVNADLATALAALIDKENAQ